MAIIWAWNVQLYVLKAERLGRHEFNGIWNRFCIINEWCAFCRIFTNWICEQLMKKITPTDVCIKPNCAGKKHFASCCYFSSPHCTCFNFKYIVIIVLSSKVCIMFKNTNINVHIYKIYWWKGHFYVLEHCCFASSTNYNNNIKKI